MNLAHLALAIAIAMSASACARPTVVRAAGGQVYRGRFISARAYEAYARGSLAEADGNLTDAARWFRTAANIDDNGPEAWTRLGAVLCKIDGKQKEAAEAFDEAFEVDPKFAGVHRERARCALSHGDAKAALASAELATILDPDDEGAVLVEAAALEAAKEPERAVRLLLAHTLTRRPSADVAAALARLARSSPNRVALERIAHSSSGSGRGGVSGVTVQGPTPSVKPTMHDIDEALGRGDLAGARKLATRARTTQGEIALRAIAMGKLALANEQATLVLDADPSDPQAAIALLFLAQSSGIASAADRLGRTTLSQTTPLARVLFAEVLLREVGPDAAKAMVEDILEPSAKPSADEDPLLRLSRERLAKALQSSASGN